MCVSFMAEYMAVPWAVAEFMAVSWALIINNEVCVTCINLSRYFIANVQCSSIVNPYLRHCEPAEQP